ncbi:ROK family protein [Panacibacter sp. DH6]|uniref:ROK family protein n=1 Tax=Panacibacter microcysteis TaxID=2793269 RepID=A0A931EAL8_9BACT|nr:ROK family protein [Panacibacter microcysteis]MBG9377334.1 ROK family protein [Panacibacter microcysteis]
MNKPALAIDLGGTNIKIGLVQSHVIVAQVSLDAHSGSGLQGRLPFIEKAVFNLLVEHNILLSDLAGMGMSVPGIVDSTQKRILSIDRKFGDAPGIDFSAWCDKAFGLKLAMENDARSALIGEWKFGKAQAYDNAVLMTLGTGVGSAAIIQGQLLRGKHFTAGILGGHTIINYNGKDCNCGNKGCVETEASTWCIAGKVKAMEGYTTSKLAEEEKIDFESIFRCAAMGDAVAVKARTESLDVWSACAINLIHAYDPEILLLSGGIMASSETIVPYIEKQVHQHAWTPWGKVKAEAASFPASAALLGAGYLVSNA